MEGFLLLGLNGYAWMTVAIIVMMFGIMLFTKLPADLVFMGSMAALLLSGVLAPQEALAGFSSVTVVTIGVLFVVVAGLTHTGVVQWIARYMLGTPKSYPKAIIRLMLPVAALSSFLSNTTVVTLFMKVVGVWSKKMNMPSSRLLIPLCYASGMGGICTLIGTPPNLLISGFYMDSTHTVLNIFTTTLPGLFCLVVGVLSVLALRRLLPDRKSPDESFESTADYTVELLVPTVCDSVGKTLQEAGLYNVQGGHLIEIVRFDKEVISPVPANEFIMGGDRLVYSGQIESILDLKRSHQLVNASHHVFTLSEVDKDRKLRTATIGLGSSLIGKEVGNTDFEERNGMVLVAVARQGERINESPRHIMLKLGDTLLLECSPALKNTYSGSDVRFFDSEEIPNIGRGTMVSGLIMTCMVLLSTFNVLPLLQSCFVAAFAMIVTRCCSVEQARRSINWDILMVFAGSICLGTAIEKTGIASQLANSILGVCGSNPILAMAGICLVAVFVSEFISNTATAAMFYPIAYQTAVTLGANPLTFCIALMIAVSSSFATPIGSPTHMLVYGVGGYRFIDFIKIGVIMDIIMLAANLFIVTLLFPL